MDFQTPAINGPRTFCDEMVTTSENNMQKWNMNVDQKFLHYQARKVYKILKYNGKGCHESVRLSINFPTTSLQQSNLL